MGLMHTCHASVALPQMARLWLSVEVVSGCTVLFGSRIINCSHEETFGNFLSRLLVREGQVLRFFPATRVLLCD